MPNYNLLEALVVTNMWWKLSKLGKTWCRKLGHRLGIGVELVRPLILGLITYYKTQTPNTPNTPLPTYIYKDRTALLVLVPPNVDLKTSALLVLQCNYVCVSWYSIMLFELHFNFIGSLVIWVWISRMWVWWVQLVRRICVIVVSLFLLSITQLVLEWWTAVVSIVLIHMHLSHPSVTGPIPARETFGDVTILLQEDVLHILLLQQCIYVSESWHLYLDWNRTDLSQSHWILPVGSNVGSCA